MIKLVVCDLDGTLIDRTEKLTDSAYQLADRLREKGILFSLATGRVQDMAEDYAKALGVHIPYVATNGASLICEGRTLYRKKIALAPMRDMILKADALGMSIIYSCDGHEEIHRESEYIRSQQQCFSRYFDIRALTDEDFMCGSVEKMCIMDDAQSGGIDEIEQLARVLGGQYTYTRYGRRAVEIVGSGCTKASGVARLARMLHVDMADILAIGDDANDLEMLCEVGKAGTVANALEQVKHLAQYVSPSPHAQGSLDVVRHFLGEKGVMEERRA